MFEFQPQITVKDIPPSPQIMVNVEKRIKKLLQFCKRINSCRVVIESSQRHKHQGKLYNVRVDLTVPGKKQLVTTHKDNEDLYIAIREAFNALDRQLEEHARKRHGRMKLHAKSVAGRIVKLFPKEGYGFIESWDGTEFYFSHTNVTYPAFTQLVIGDMVDYTPEALNEGWQAHHVSKRRPNQLLYDM